MPDQGADLALLSQRVGALHEDIGDMKMVLRELTAAVNKLALVEQQQEQTAKAMERAFIAIEKIEGRVSDIEKKLPEVTRTSVWVDRAVWGIVAAVMTFFAKKNGLL